jgi:hypothetical protein
MRPLLLLALLLIPAAALAQSSSAPPPPPLDPKLAEIAAHAAGIAVAIRGIVALLRSPVGGLVWLRLPVQVRLLALAVLCGVAVGFEALAAGRTIPEAIFVAIGGLGGAVTTHEIQERIKPARRRS